MLPLIPIVALAAKLLPVVQAVPEVVEALKSGNAVEAAGKVVDMARAVTGEADKDKAVEKVLADPATQLKYQELLSAERIKFAELALAEAQMYVDDTSDARHVHAGDRGVFWLGVVILLTFAVLVGGALYGAYQIMTDGIKISDPGVIAAAAGFAGTLVGYVAANAQQVVSYFFGSSRGSAERGRDMADAVKRLASGTP